MFETSSLLDNVIWAWDTLEPSVLKCIRKTLKKQDTRTHIHTIYWSSRFSWTLLISLLWHCQRNLWKGLDDSRTEKNKNKTFTNYCCSCSSLWNPSNILLNLSTCYSKYNETTCPFSFFHECVRVMELRCSSLMSEYLTQFFF